MSERQPKEQPEDPSKRKFLRNAFLGGLGLATAAAVGGGAVGAEIGRQQERDEPSPELVTLVRELRAKDLKDPLSPQLEALVREAHLAYGNITGAKDHPLFSDIQARTSFYATTEAFVEAVRQDGDTDYDPTTRYIYGTRRESSHRIFMNLEHLLASAQETTAYPARRILQSLFHEWTHEVVEPREDGDYIHNQKFLIRSKTNHDLKEPVTEYEGGRITTDSMTALGTFDEAWSDLIAYWTVFDALKSDVELLRAEADETTYVARRRWLARVAQQAGISTLELATLHSASDFEGFMRRLGHVFDPEAVQLWQGWAREHHGEEGIKEDADFFIGQDLAFKIHNENQEGVAQLFRHLK